MVIGGWRFFVTERAEDFVIATGKQLSVRDFIRGAAARLGLEIEFSGEGLQEIGTVAAIDSEVADPETTSRVGDVIVRVDPKYYRPSEVDTLLGDPRKAREQLGWEPRTSVTEMIAEMMAHDLTEARKQRHLRDHGFQTNLSQE